jgi:DNA-binding CsgD family transcriptional regulator
LDALKDSPLTRSDLARLVHHAEGAGDRDTLVACAPSAARQARAVGSNRAAAALFNLALQVAHDLPLAEQAGLLTDYSVICDALDQRPQAITARRQAADLWRQAGNLLKYGESLGHLALLLHLTGDNAQAEQINNQAIAVLEGLPPNRELAIIYNSQALLHLATLENARGVAMAEKNLALAHRIEDETLFPRLYETLGLCWLHRDYTRGIAYLEQSLDMALHLGQTIRSANTYANLCSVYVEFYLFPQATACFTTGLAYMAERDMESTRLYALAWRAQWHLLIGRWAEAAEDVRAVMELPGTSIGSRGPALMVLGRLRARQGEPDADVALDESLELLFKLGYRQREGMVRAARAEAAWLAGDQERTLAEARAFYEIAVSQQNPWATGELAFWRWRAGDEVVLPEWVAEPYRLQIQGDWAAAAAAWSQLGCPYEQARALADGDVEAQLAALEMFDGLGAKPAAAQLRQQMRQSGIANIPRGPRPSTRENPFGLTTRQRDILALLAQELTNVEIAARLHLSTKTVDHHVSAILAKLNVSTRTDAAAIARQHGELRS